MRRPFPWLLLLWLLSVPAYADVTDGQKLLALFGKLQGMTAHFREEKRIALLSAPLVNEGTVAYQRPGRFVRHTTKPATSSILVHGDVIEVGTAKDHEQFNAGSQPVIRAFLDGYLGLMEGDAAKLERAYQVSLTGDPAAAWHLTLTPKNPQLLRIIQRIDADGKGGLLTTMTVREASGDVSVTTFTAVDVHHTFSAEESARLFRLP